MIWGTALASIVPLQLTACGGSSSEPGSGGNAGQANHAGGAGESGHSNVGGGGTDQGIAGYFVLAIAAFGNDGGGLPGAGTGGSDVMMGGSGGETAGSGGKQPNGSAGFIVLAAAAFGGKE
ncbi:MAG TPA: hypothetical protein VGF76_20575 [Polyangiaceae bacterium]